MTIASRADTDSGVSSGDYAVANVLSEGFADALGLGVEFFTGAFDGGCGVREAGLASGGGEALG